MDLRALEAPQVSHAQTVNLGALKLIEMRARPLPLRKRGRYGLGREAAEAIEKQPLLRLIKRAHGLPLRVDQRKLGRELTQAANRGRLIVDKDATFALGGDLAPEQDLV